MIRLFYISSGFLSLGLGILGAFLPLLPTTPFVLLSAFLFQKSSPRLHAWLRDQRFFGPLIKDWEQNQMIRMKAKILSTLMIAITISYPLFFRDFSLWLKALVVLCISGSLTYIWTRPSKPKVEEASKVMLPSNHAA